jgi:hypothetical protein
MLEVSAEICIGLPVRCSLKLFDLSIRLQKVIRGKHFKIKSNELMTID